MSVTLKEENQLGIVEFNQPDSKVNVLDGETLKKLDFILELLKEKTHLKAVLFVSTKKDVFIAGADIKEIEKIKDPADGAVKAKAGVSRHACQDNIKNMIQFEGGTHGIADVIQNR